MVNFNLDFRFDKNKGISCVQIEIKMKKNKKENFLKHWAIGLRSKGN